VNDGGCYGSVLLANELWHSLTSMNGRDVPWVHGCVLDHGHDDDHGAPAYQVDGQPQQWLRWSDSGSVRIEHVEASPPGRHSRPPRAAAAVDRPPQPVAAEAPPAHRPSDAGSPGRDPQADALWAIAAAIDRLADAILGLRNPMQDK
jgi:hypothetical protein